jgi:hypothetical protein
MLGGGVTMSDNKSHRLREEEILTSAKAESEAPVQRAADTVVGRTGWDVISGMLGALKRPAVAFTFYLCLMGVITLLAILNVHVTHGKEGLAVEFRRLSNTPTPEVKVAPSHVERLIEAGRAAKKPYILEYVNILIRVRDVKNGGGLERHVEWRISYIVHALQPIRKTDKLFKEKYIIAGARTMRWFGNEQEIDTTDGCYQVMFDLAEGETRSITTGATNVFDLPLGNNRNAFGQRISLAPNQQFLSYENDEDVIGELSMTIESDNLNISPVGEAAKRSKVEGIIAPDAECRFQSAEKQRSLSARWKDVMPNEEVGIHFKVE